MILQRRDVLQSEIREVQRILEMIPEENVIDRFALENRLEDLRAEYAQLPSRSAEPERLALTFRGAPVRGSSAISADFAGIAASEFVDAFAAIVAGLRGSLNYSGPIPDKATAPLMVTGVATGSFGFEMEVPSVQHDFFREGASAASAVEIFRELLRVAAQGSDDEITDIVLEVHPRAVRKVADFLSTVAKKGAWCGLEFRNKFFKFRSLEELRDSEQRLRKENIAERTEEYFGEFQGFLPAGRNFEFVVADGSGLIRGRLGPDIEDTASLNKEWLHRPTFVKFNVIQVGQGRPRYTLQSLSDLVPAGGP